VGQRPINILHILICVSCQWPSICGLGVDVWRLGFRVAEHRHDLVWGAACLRQNICGRFSDASGREGDLQSGFTEGFIEKTERIKKSCG